MLHELFTFPIVMIDGENEERKEREASILNKDDDGYDIVFGEAEYPYYDFIGTEDRWLPTDESLQRALSGKFDACIVKFANIPQLLCPWPRAKFKKELKKFVDTVEREKSKQEVSVIKITPDQLERLKDLIVPQKREDEDEEE